MRILVLGIGNPILGNDAAGILAIRELKRMFKRFNVNNVYFDESSDGGFRLAEKMLGYDKVIIIDTIKDNESTEEGTVRVIDLYELMKKNENMWLANPHDADLITAMKILSSAFKDEMPREVIIYGIKISSSFTFSEQLSDSVRNAIKKVVKMILEDLGVKN